MSQKPITPLLFLCFVRSFLVSIGSFAAMMFIAAATPSGVLTPTIVVFLVVFLILMIASGLVWYVSLGMLASRLGLSWLVWVGLSFIFCQSRRSWPSQ